FLVFARSSSPPPSIQTPCHAVALSLELPDSLFQHALFRYGLPKDSSESVHSSPPSVRRNADKPIPPRPWFYGCSGLVSLSSYLGLQVADQLRCGFTGKVFEAGNLKAGKHLPNVCLVIVCSSAQGK